MLTNQELTGYAPLGHALRQLRVPKASKLVGLTLSESRLGDAVDVQILCIVRQDGTAVVPTSDDRFAANDRLLVWGTDDMISILLMQGLEGMFIEDSTHQLDPSILEDDQVGLVEVTLSPHSDLERDEFSRKIWIDRSGHLAQGDCLSRGSA